MTPNNKDKGEKPTDDSFLITALSVLIAFCFLVYAGMALVEIYQLLSK